VNPNHMRNLEAALYKFGFLTYPQVFNLFAGDIRGSTVDRYIGRLARDKLMIANRSSETKCVVYTHWTETYLGITEYSLSKHYLQSPRELSHRIACNDVYLNLAKCAFVTSVTSEHEIKRFKIDSEVIDRNPDGVFTLIRPGRKPMYIAIEVETTLRSRSRIAEVVQAYVTSHIRRGSRLNGVLIVAAKPNIAAAYREVIEQIAAQHRLIYIISERLDLSDVKETLLGRPVIPFSEHPHHLLKNWVSTCPRKPLQFENARARKNIVPPLMFPDTSPEHDQRK
jgi:hypothetical protein